MPQEFFVNNETLQQKIRELLPSQGGMGAGFDLTASTGIVPIVDLTESAEGSNVRADLQTAISFKTANVFSAINTTNSLINTTGFYRIIGTSTVRTDSATTATNTIQINDGSSDKDVWKHANFSSNTDNLVVSENVDFVILLEAGHTLKFKSNSTKAIIAGSVRQIASLDGTLTNP
jgi:hypothetical protein